MKRSGKNYLNLVAGLLLFYFLMLAILGANEERLDLLRINPQSTPQISIGWYILIALLGAALAGVILWAFVSRRNEIDYKTIFHTKKDQIWLGSSALAGGAAAVLLGFGMIGTLPEMRITLDTHKEQTVAKAESETSGQPAEPSTESVYQAPVPELPPLKPSDNKISQATGVLTISDKQTVTGAITADQPDQSCLLALDQSAVTVDQAVLSKKGDPTVFDNALKYGLNAALVAAPGSTVNVLGTTINTSALGAGGVAVNGLNASATLTSSNISTTGPNSPVFFAGFQGQLKVTAGTQTSTADGSTIFVPRASSTIQADNLTCQTAGNLAPIVRASGIFTASGLNANATNSVFAQIEPGGAVNISSSRFTAGARQSDTGYQAVFVFDNQDKTQKQEPGHLALNTCEWMINPTSPAVQNGWNFLVDSCSAEISLTKNTITQVPQCAKVMKGNLLLALASQTLSGPIVGDEDSRIEITMVDGSNFTGSINADNACPKVNLHMDATSTLALTGDLYLTEFNNANGSNSNVQTNGYHIYVEGKQVL